MKKSSSKKAPIKPTRNMESTYNKAAKAIEIIESEMAFEEKSWLKQDIRELLGNRKILINISQ